jgi:hypothetical protein
VDDSTETILSTYGEAIDLFSLESLRQGCACRKRHLGRSSNMSILAEDSAKTILSADGESFDPVGFKGLRQGLQGCRCGE